MKSFKNLLSVLVVIFLFAGCQKEYSVETGNAGGLAKGTLKDAAGNCQPFSANGTYTTNSTLTDSNYILVQVNITSPGVYKISTDLQNGFSFKDSGYIGTTGLKTIKLKGSGAPILSQSTDFTVSFDTSFCFFSITVDPGTPTGPAGVYTLSGAGAGCTGAIPQGTYTTGTALNNTNFVVLNVNVTTAGSWSVITNQVNGMRFGGTGTFTTTGPQTIQLTGLGTPATAGPSTIPVTAGSSTCSFNVTVAQGTGGGGTTINDADSAWSFTSGTRFFHGPYDYLAVDTTYPGIGYGVGLVGSTSATGDSVCTILLLFPTGTIQTGTYNTSTLFAYFYFEDYRDPNNTVDIYTSDNQNATVTSNVAITVSSWNPTTRIISGTFSGTAKNAANVNVPITGGKFTAKLD